MRLAARGLRRQIAGPFDLGVDAGDCLAITGASGSGKSVLLRMLADLDPCEGEVWLDGAGRTTISAPAWRRKVAYCPAESGWWADGVASHFPDMEAARALAPAFGLRLELLEAPVLRLSTGERQRLALLRALTHDPSVLLLDEPTGPLDPDSVALVEALLRRLLDRGTAIVLVTHAADQAARLATQRLVMTNGRLAPA
jgi:putative ABC transport system ATP-binding protein